MKVTFKKSIELSLRQSAVLYLAISLALAISVIFLHVAMNKEMKVNKTLLQLNLLSENLMNTTSYLSREARSYVTDHDEKHLSNYFNIVNLDRTREKLTMELIQLGLSGEEYKQIEEINKHSQTLQRVDVRAMHLAAEAAGVPKWVMHPDIADYKLTEKEKALPQNEKTALSRFILFGRWYDNQLDKVQQILQNFQTLVNSRCRLEIRSAKRMTNFLLFELVFLAVLIPILFIFDLSKRYRAEQEVVENQEKLMNALSELRKAHIDLQRTQSKLIHAEKFATIGQLAGMISHEFRNELGSMRNAVYFLKMRLTDGDEKVRRHLDILDDRIAETDRIIENIMAFARTQKPKLEPTDLSQLIFTSIGKVKIPGNIQVHTEMEPDLPKIMADEIHLRRAFVNIILNAVQGMQNKGGQLNITATKENDYVRILFTDNGPGIKEDHKDKLFEPLFTTKARGAGLGLSTVQLLIEGHDGTIDIESEYGKGTTVAVRLPFE